MRIDLERALSDIAHTGQVAASPVPVPRVLQRMHRRRALRSVALSAGGPAAATAVPLGGALVFGNPVTEEPPAPPATEAAPAPSPSPSETALDTSPVPGWVPGPAPCGEQYAVVPTDSLMLGIEGGVVPGEHSTVTAMFSPGGAETTVNVDVMTTAHTPGQAVEGELTMVVRLLDEAGTVALFWPPHDRVPGPGPEATDGSGRTAVTTLADAVDCRTGQPLRGTYRVVAESSVVGTAEIPGPAVPEVEITELAPVTFGAPARTGGPPALPRCGEPADPALLDGTLVRDFEVTIDGKDPQAALSLGIGQLFRFPLTVTRTDADDAATLSGYVPQALRAALVDSTGTVVSAPLWPTYPTGQVFDVAPGDTFASGVEDLDGGCVLGDGRTFGPRPGGIYDLYLYDTVEVTAADGTRSARLAVGGPYAVTFTD